jgi:hypothetical protein
MVGDKPAVRTGVDVEEAVEQCGEAGVRGDVAFGPS